MGEVVPKITQLSTRAQSNDYRVSTALEMTLHDHFNLSTQNYIGPIFL